MYVYHSSEFTQTKNPSGLFAMAFTLTFKLLKDMLGAPDIIRIDNKKKSPLIQKLQNSFTHNNQKYLLEAFPALTFFKM